MTEAIRHSIPKRIAMAALLLSAMKVHAAVEIKSECSSEAHMESNGKSTLEELGEEITQIERSFGECTRLKLTVLIDVGEQYLSKPVKITFNRQKRPHWTLAITGRGNQETNISGGKSLVHKRTDSDQYQSHLHNVNIMEIPSDFYYTSELESFEKRRPTANSEIYTEFGTLQEAEWPKEHGSRVRALKDAEGSITIHFGDAVPALHGENLKIYGFFGNEWGYRENIGEWMGNSTLRLSSNDQNLKSGSRVWLKGSKQFLTNSLEWAIDQRNGSLLWRSDETKEVKDYKYSVRDSAIEINDSHNVHISNITISGFRGTAIAIRSSDSIVVKRIKVRSIGGKGILISKSSRSGVEDSIVSDTGEEAVTIDAGNRDKLTPAGSYVRNSTLTSFGRRVQSYAPAIALLGVGNEASGNIIHDGPHSAIIYHGNDHKIVYNRIRDVAQKTSDAGIIYTGGDWTARGTSISNNTICGPVDNGYSAEGNKAIYLDDQASGNTVSSNTIVDAQQAIFVGGGRDNAIYNNYVFGGNIWLKVDARGLGAQRGALHDKSSSFQTKFNSVPSTTEPYVSRYPELANVLTKLPGAPIGNKIRDNSVRGVGIIALEPAAIPYLSLSNNHFTKEDHPSQVKLAMCNF